MPDLQTLTVTGWTIVTLGFCVILFAGYIVVKDEDGILPKK
jgi:hypothetical protein